MTTLTRPSFEASAAPPARVAIVGVGNVGATTAFALLLGGLAAEIVLIDANHDRAEGEARDLNHAVPFALPTRIWAGDYADCAGAVVTVVTAGANQRLGEPRLDLLRRNAGVFGAVIPPVAQANPGGIILVATNPVDVLTYGAIRLSQQPHARVMGSGTILDTARFRFLLGQYLGVDPRSVHAAIIGEHGDSEVPLWSSANVAGVRVEALATARGIPFDADVRASLFAATRDAAYEIIQRKGATYYAVAAGLVRIVEAIVRDQHTVLSVSSLLHGEHGLEDVCLSLPAVVGRNGVEQVLGLDLAPDEADGLRHSAGVLRAALDQVQDLWPRQPPG